MVTILKDSSEDTRTVDEPNDAPEDFATNVCADVDKDMDNEIATAIDNDK